MSSRVRLALAFTSMIGAAALAGGADAQQATPPAPGGANAPPATSNPNTSNPTTTNPTTTNPTRSNPTTGNSASGTAAANDSAATVANVARVLRRGRLLARLAALSPADRAAVIDARLAALRAGLELTPDQQKLWSPFENAARNGINQALNTRQRLATEGRPSDPMQRLQRLSELASARADALKAFVAAAQPLFASLSPDQKGRLPLLMATVNDIGRRANAEREGRLERGFGQGRRERGSEGSRMGEDNEGAGGEREAGPQQSWRERMRERMERMNQNRDEWRGGGRRGEDYGYDEEGARGPGDESDAGPQQSWRERMRERMEQMTQNRNGWRHGENYGYGDDDEEGGY